MSMLSLEYRKVGQLATCLGNERIRISADGRVYHSENTQECETGELWSDDWREVGRLDAGALAQLALAIEKSGLLSLESESIDEIAEGGKREELDISLDETEYHFTVQNNEQLEFRKVVKLLWGAVSIAELVVAE